MQIYLKNYDLRKYVEFGAISWNFDILSITAYSEIFYSCQFIKSFRPFHSLWEEEDLSREINTSFTEWHHLSHHEYPVSGSSSQQCHGIPLKVSCLFLSILDHYKNFSRQSVIEVSNQNRTHMTFSHKTQAKTFTWPNMSFYAR